ncbi:hypothetical protein ACWEWI_39760 [Streptomyces sp. NPDC003753]
MLFNDLPHAGVLRFACPDITRACDLARAFADLVRHQRGYLLPEWIRQAEKDAPKPMKGFAGFLRQDLDSAIWLGGRLAKAARDGSRLST